MKMKYTNKHIGQLSDFDIALTAFSDENQRNYVSVLLNALERSIRDATKYQNRIQYLEGQLGLSDFSASELRKTTKSDSDENPLDDSGAIPPGTGQDAPGADSPPDSDDSASPDEPSSIPDDSSWSSDLLRFLQELENEKHASKRKKIEQNTLAQTERICLKPADLPDDAEFLRVQEFLYQDLEFVPIRKLFLREVYFSESENRFIVADLPEGYNEHQHYGPGISAFLLQGKSDYHLTETKLEQFFKDHGISISSATINRLSLRLSESVFEQESREICAAGVETGAYLHLDDTGWKHDGKNYHTQIFGNPHFTAYITTEGKDRPSVLEMLHFGEPIRYLFDDEALELMEKFKVSQQRRVELASWFEGRSDRWLEAEELDRLRIEIFGEDPECGKTVWPKIVDAAGLIGYRNREDIPVVEILLCDNAPQFKHLTMYLGLCWVHGGRGFMKLSPSTKTHRTSLDEFVSEYWDFYGELLAYQKHSSPEEAGRLREAFRDLCARRSGYAELDEMVERLGENESSYLLVLDHPEIPLHNNPIELEARVVARQRDMSYGTRSPKGLRFRDTMNTVVRTCRKLGINVWNYIYERLSGSGDSGLVGSIRERAKPRVA